MSISVFLLLGSNLGNRLEHLAHARLEISRQIGPIITASSIYKTAAWGETNQPDFYNQVVKLDCELHPDHILQCILDIEEKAGRVRTQKWGPRTIDIDILFYGNEIIATDRLTIPHPEIQNRKFTLLPLAEIDSDFVHPKLKKTIGELLSESHDQLLVEKL